MGSEEISLQWFFELPGLFITCGVLLILIALLVFIVSGSKKKKEDVYHTDDGVDNMTTNLVDNAIKASQVDDSINQNQEQQNIVGINSNSNLGQNVIGVDQIQSPNMIGGSYVSNAQQNIVGVNPVTTAPQNVVGVNPVPNAPQNIVGVNPVPIASQNIVGVNPVPIAPQNVVGVNPMSNMQQNNDTVQQYGFQSSSNLGYDSIQPSTNIQPANNISNDIEEI